MNKQVETEKFMRSIAEGMNQLIHKHFNEKVGFAVLLFPFNKPGLSNYVSNAERSDMIKTLREAADRIEKNGYMPPAISDILQ